MHILRFLTCDFQNFVTHQSQSTAAKTNHNESDEAQAQSNKFFNNWKRKVDKGGNMELSDTVEGENTRMSEIPDSPDHQGTNGRKKIRKRRQKKTTK